MKFLPFEKYTISTKMSIKEAKQRLLDNLEPDRDPGYVLNNRIKPFTGRIGERGFTISRVIWYRNSFFPDIKGHFISEIDHTEIHIVMRPITLVLVFMGIWMAGMMIACAASLGSLLSTERVQPFSAIELLPFGMILFGYTLCMVGFKVERKKAKRFLMELWK